MRPSAGVSQSRARVAAPSMDARSLRLIRARQPSRAASRIVARVLSGRARKLGTFSARDDKPSLTGAIPLRCPNRLAVRARTSSDIFGHLAVRERTSARISRRLEIRRGGVAVRIPAFGGHLRTSWASAPQCVECVPDFDDGGRGML